MKTKRDHSPDSILEIIRAFVVRARGELPGPLDLDTALLDTGMVDSFDLIDLGTEISTELEIPMLMGNLLPEDFETPRVLWNRIQEISS